MKAHHIAHASFRAKLLAALVAALLSAGSATPLKTQTSSPQDARLQHKRALLIGISKYQKKGVEGEWRDLNTELDLELLQKVLVEKFAFAPSDIVVLRDEKATKDAILSELKKLFAQTGKGDIVFVHFSGHGDSIPDDDGDEIDGKDESLIPFDYITRNYASPKDYSKNIRDDEIGKILDQLKKKEPGNVTISIDSCYSGTTTRGDYAVRGGGGDAAKPDNESPSGLQEKNISYPKGYVLLAASSPRQTAKETDYDDRRRMGIYTLALVKALNAATPQTTYRDLFEHLNDTITSTRGDQNPQFEGSPDVKVFDGTAIKQERYFKVRPVTRGKKDDKVILQTGRLLGATAGSRYDLYAGGTKDPGDKDAVKLAEGEIVEVDATTSVLKLNLQIEAEKLGTARAFESRHYYEDTTLKVIMQDLKRVKGGEDALAEFVKKGSHGSAVKGAFSLAEFNERKQDESLRVEQYDVKIYPAGAKEIKDGIVPASFAGLVMERKDGSILATIAEGDSLTGGIKTALERENRFRTIKSLKDNEDPRLKIDLRLIPVDVKLDAAGRIVSTIPRSGLSRNAGGLPELKLGDTFMLEVENRGELDVHVTILNLRSDGKIGPGFPQKVEGTPDNLIKRGKTIRLPLPYVFVITKPLGEESFRAIATVEPTDFTPLIDEDLIGHARGGGQRGEDVVSQLLRELERGEKGGTRGGANNAAQSPLGRILLASAIGTRSNLASSAPPSWATSSFTFLVKEK